MLAYIKGFVVLVVLLTILMHMTLGKSYQKYIHFFVELILTLALLKPILSIVYDNGEFLEQVDYVAFTEELESVAMDMEQMEYLYSDYHKEAYERAIAEDVRQMAEGKGFFVQDVSVRLSEEYTVEYIFLQISESEEEQIMVGRINLQEAYEERGTVISEELRQELIEYYQIEESQIDIQYNGK